MKMSFLGTVKTSFHLNLTGPACATILQFITEYDTIRCHFILYYTILYYPILYYTILGNSIVSSKLIYSTITRKKKNIRFFFLCDILSKEYQKYISLKEFHYLMLTSFPSCQVTII